MIPRLGLSLVSIISLISAVNTVCQAQSLSPMTRHVRDVTQNGQAHLVGYPSPTNTLRLVLVLPLRNQKELDTLLNDLYNLESPVYRHFLTVEEFTARFGPTEEDYSKVAQFAESHGLIVVGTSPNRVNLEVTGSITAIENAFHVKLGLYQHPAESRTFYAPDREPTANLDVQLWHISGLDNYSIPRQLFHRRDSNAQPSTTTGSGPSFSFLGSDMRAAYYGGSLTGTGQSLGLVEFFGTDLADLNTYYKNVGQTNNVIPTLKSVDGTSTSCTCSVVLSNSCFIGCDDTEQTLDMTQALGMAPGLSSLVMYIGSSNPLNDAGIFNAMATANPLNAQLSCSWAWKPADAATDDVYFKEFAAQGQNLFQASGDSGAWPNSSGFYFPAEDAYVTAVGGTDLTSSSAGGPWASETAWVDGGGGISPDGISIPSWQQATAGGCSNCSQTLRNAPDVSANANFTFYVCANQHGCTANVYGGTSFAAPMWAGYLALVNQQSVADGGKPLGFINPSLYTIGLSSSYDTDFHDITSGSNGYSATTGYDLATGWGSPNGSGLLNALAAPPTPSFSLSASPASVSVAQGNSGMSTVTSTVTGGFSSAITLSASGQPSGVTVTFSPNPIAAPGSGSSTMTMAVASSVTPNTYTITVIGTGGGITQTTTVSLVVTVPDFTISASPTSVSVAQGNSGTSTITTNAKGGFSSAITLSASGQPSGVTVTFSPNPIAAPGSGSSTMTMAVASSVTPNTYTITVMGTGGGITHTTAVSLIVTGLAPDFSISANPTTLSVARGTSGTSTISTTALSGFNSSISLSASVSGGGLSVSFNPTSLAAPGTGSSTMTVTVSRRAKVGTRTITVTGSGGGVTHSTTVTVNVQ